MNTTVKAEAGEVYFYQVEDSAEDLTFSLVRKSRKNGWRVCVRGDSIEQLEKFETRLWMQPDKLFMGIGMEGSEFDSDHSVLLTATDNRANDPEVLVVLPGTSVEPEEVRGFRRAMLVFSKKRTEDTAIARRHWKALAAHGFPMKYFGLQQGKWQMIRSIN